VSASSLPDNARLEIIRKDCVEVILDLGRQRCHRGGWQRELRGEFFLGPVEAPGAQPSAARRA